MSAEFPFVGATRVQDTSTLPLFKMYGWDFDKDCFICDEEGHPILLEGNEALKIWIIKALKTERFMYLAYSWRYGADLKKFIGRVLGVQERRSELRREITECLLVNAYIKSIEKMEFVETENGKDLQINITLTTIYGKLTV